MEPRNKIDKGTTGLTFEASIVCPMIFFSPNLREHSLIKTEFAKEGKANIERIPTI